MVKDRKGFRTMLGSRWRIEAHNVKSIPDDSGPFAVRPASHRGASTHQLGRRLRKFAFISSLLVHQESEDTVNFLRSNTLAISNLKNENTQRFKKTFNRCRAVSL